MKEGLTMVTGGSGLLGEHLLPLLEDVFTPAHIQVNIREKLTDHPVIINKTGGARISQVLHMAALRPVACEQNKREALRTNIVGTANVAEFCHEYGCRMIYISTDYIFRGDKGDYDVLANPGPVNYYGETKLAGEYVVKSLPNYLIIRLSFKPEPYPYPQAFIDQETTAFPVSKAAEEIAKLVNDPEKSGIVHLAYKKQSLFHLAMEIQGDEDITSITLDMVGGPPRPRDTSLVPGHVDFCEKNQ